MLDTATMTTLILATVIGYLLGSIPMAMLVGRLRGIDIFSTGTRLAGAANVYRNVGPYSGGLVFAGDVSKGVLTVVAAHRLGVEGEMVLIPALAALIGHWRSIFARLRGGDGLSTMVGITVAVFPVYGLLSVLTGAVVAAIARGTGHQPSLWGGSAGYGFLLIRAPAIEEATTMVAGIVLLALLVLAHSVVGHRRRAISL